MNVMLSFKYYCKSGDIVESVVFIIAQGITILFATYYSLSWNSLEYGEIS